MTACPCCGKDLGESVLDPKWLRILPLGSVERTVVSELTNAFPEALTAADLANRVYAGVRGGGPVHADATIRVTASNLKRKLEPFGWKVINTTVGGGQFAAYRLAPA